MRADEILQAMEQVDDELLERSETEGIRRKRRNRWRKWAAAAAGLALLLMTGILWNTGNVPDSERDSDNSGDNRQNPLAQMTEDTEQLSGEQQENGQAQDYATVAALLASAGDQEGVENEALKIARIDLEDQTAIYEGVYFSDSEALQESLGEPLPQESGEDWYLVAGHTDKQYLIHREESGNYTLWEFAYFDSTSYSYGDVLTGIYGLEDPADVEKIIVGPSRINNTDEGETLQEEIGVREISDPQEIAALYDIWASMSCYGGERWDLINNGAEDVDYQGAGEGGLEAVRQGRCLTVVTAKGEEIHRLKYTGISHMFYEYSGVAYEPLAEEAAAQVEAVLGIER